ncbi:MAG: hypothetical protein REI64_05415 [Pedobacter sp.]|uniref:hypothetical protein n=1 Tax=Pedobacter sp. TaxID=1411316 RepID=UPI00280784AE|nr:hypothetical protein [Pedobacter sp.]MDQ8004218.1 hypothetical protein [Pedobacter sp.]
MNKNQFIEKFKFKSDEDLLEIAINSKSFVFEARHAAVTLLKSRNHATTIINKVEQEGKELKRIKAYKTEKLKQQKQYLIRRIREIPIRGTGKYRLENGNELQVKRLNEDSFQVRIEDNYRSVFAAVLICKIKGESSYTCFPFLYLKSILIYGIGGIALAIIFSFFGYLENDILIFFTPLIFVIGLQILLMPFTHFVILNFFKQRLNEKK